jgi:hypothetical protein
MISARLLSLSLLTTWLIAGCTADEQYLIIEEIVERLVPEELKKPK